MSEIGGQRSEVCRKSEEKQSTFCAENCSERKLVRRESARTAKALRVAVRDVGMRPVMTGAKVFGSPHPDKAFNVKLS
jgi:hypothetical protein